MSDEKFKINWSVPAILGLISLISLFLTRNKPILKWIVGFITLVIFIVIAYVAMLSFGIPPILFPVLVIGINFFIAFVLKVPIKWTVISSIGLTIIYLIIRFTPRNSGKSL